MEKRLFIGEKKVNNMAYKNIEDKREHERIYYYNHLEEMREYNNKWAREYRKKFPSKMKDRDKEKYLKNKSNIKIRQKLYNLNHKCEISSKKMEYKNKKYKENKDFAIKERLRALLFYGLNNFSNGKKYSSKQYGVDFTKIIEHLKPFPKDISKYHIDHIRPLCSFSFVNEDDTENIQQIREAFRPENHQWLLAKDNLKKGSLWKKNNL
jgi:hypothetical protein